MKTFEYSGDRSLKVTVNTVGTVTESNSDLYPVGMRKAVKQLRACGWIVPRQRTQYDVFGSRIYVGR